jgi:hypothetical protein
MNLKSLFFVDAATENTKPEVMEPTKFPTNTAPTTFPTTFPSSTPVPTQSFGNSASNPHLSTFIGAYEKCFDDANQAGYDFYEFFQAIMNSGGSDNPQMYVMAMSMGMAMDKTCNKSKLLTQADFYLNEINKVYSQIVASGNAKKQEYITQKDSENQNLTNELSNLRSQLEAIQNQIRSREAQLSLIDSKYVPLINEAEEKIQANEMAKNVITSNILKVKDGINNNLK